MYAEKGMAATKQDREITLNERLNTALNTLGYQCERIESVLGRVNGTPQRLQDAKAGIAPTPVSSLSNNVEALEGIAERLVSLTNGMERIA